MRSIWFSLMILTTVLALGSCKSKKAASAGEVMGQSDVLLTKYLPWENTLALLAPGENVNAPNGRWIIQGGQNTTPRIFPHALFTSADAKTLDITPPDSFNIGVYHADFPTRDFGTDNIVIRLPEGKLMSMRNGSIWSQMENPPWWADTLIEGPATGPKAGARGAIHFWISSDGGKAWKYRGVIDMGAPELRAFGQPRKMDCQDNADVADSMHCAVPGRRRWHIGGGDRSELYRCPYTGNLYVTTRVISGAVDSLSIFRNEVLLFKSTNMGQNWQLIKEGITAISPTVMTSTPDSSLFLFQAFMDEVQLFFTDPNPGPAASFYGPFDVRYREQGGALDQANADSVLIDRLYLNPGIMRITSVVNETNAVNIAYSVVNQWNNMEYRVVNVSVDREEKKLLNTVPVAKIQASSPKTHSVTYGSFIQPDGIGIPPKDQTGLGCFYYMEAPRTATVINPEYAIKYRMFKGAQYSSSQDLPRKNGSFRTFSAMPGTGDYMYGSFFYLKGEYYFGFQWPETDGIHGQMVKIKPGTIF